MSVSRQVSVLRINLASAGSLTTSILATAAVDDNEMQSVIHDWIISNKSLQPTASSGPTTLYVMMPYASNGNAEPHAYVSDDSSVITALAASLNNGGSGTKGWSLVTVTPDYKP